MTNDLDLPTLINERLEKLAWQQKQLANAWHDATGKGRASRPSTYESRLSNLMNDEEDGYAFLRDPTHGVERLQALATALDVPLEELQSIVDATVSRPTIIFGDDLPKECVVFFERRARAFPGRVRAVRANGESSAPTLRERLRDAARKYRNVFVVVTDDRDHDFYAGGGVRTTTIAKAGRGFRIAEVPELSLQSPARTVDADEMPMFPDEMIETEYRKKIKYGAGSADAKWLERIAEADSDDSPVTFRHDWLMEKRGCERPTPIALQEIALVLAARDAGLVRDESRSQREDPISKAEYTLRGFCWWQQRRLLGFSDADAQKRAAAPVVIQRISTFAPVVEKLASVMRGMNPRGTEDVVFDVAEEVGRFGRESGIALSFDAEMIRTAFKRWTAAPGESAESAVPIYRDEEHDARVHSALDEILSRGFEVPLAEASCIWMLQLVREASLLHAKSADDDMEAIADLGTGNVLRFHVRRFPCERPMPMRLWKERYGSASLLDGGNIRFAWWPKSVDETLEGTNLKAVERRREQARRETAEAAACDD